MDGQRPPLRRAGLLSHGELTTATSPCPGESSISKQCQGSTRKAAIAAAGDWRAKKAEQYTQDLRHERSAQALRKLHGQVEALPDDHPAFARLARAWGRLIADEDDINEIIKAEEALIGRYGFDGEEAGAEEFLASLLDTALKDELPAGRA